MGVRQPVGGQILVSIRTPARGVAVALVFLLFGFGACSATPRAKAPVQPLHTPVLSSTWILAPVRGDAEIELRELADIPTTPSRLRQAWILLQTRRPQAAIDLAAAVLYGVERPSPAEEAWCRFLRAEGFAALGEPSRGTFDRNRARELALDPELRRRLEPAAAPAAGPTTADAPAGPLAQQRRATWNPAPPVTSRLDPMGRPWRVTVHHSALYFRDHSANTAGAQVRQIQREHMVDRGYGDIGYHYLIDPAGRVWEGRDVRWQGAHARGEHNQGNIGICVLGNFVRGAGGQFPSEAQARTLNRLLTQVMSRYQIPPAELHTHRDFVKTECPGALLQALVDRYRRDAAAGRTGAVAAREE